MVKQLVFRCERMKRILINLCICCTLFLACDNQMDNPRDPTVQTLTAEVFDFAQKQMKYAVQSVDSARKIKEDAFQSEISPVAVDSQTGQLVMKSAYDWRCGFYAGNLWKMYEYTRDNFWMEKAIEQTWLLEPACTFSKHDMGFMINNSFGKAYRITGDERYFTILKTAANTLLARFNPQVGCINAWDSSSKWQFPVIIDTMMNLELLFEMTRLTGDSAYCKAAISHADNTLKNHFRTDYSSYHVVDYNPITGDVNKKETAQGYSNESFWSRGQAWGLYGFTLCYRYTKDSKYLAQAQNIADLLLSLNYDNDRIPYWDMKSPSIPNDVRDASAAAIMSSALLELAGYLNDAKRSRYYDYAISILNSLHTSYQSEIGGNYGFLLLHSTSNKPSNIEVDVPLIYADYYYLEAVGKVNEIKN